MFTLGTLFRYLLSLYFDLPYTTFDFIFTSFMSSIGALLADVYVILPSPLALYNYFVHGKNVFSGIELPIYFKMERPSGETSNLPLNSSQDSLPQQGVSKERAKLEQRVIDEIFTESIKKEYDTFSEQMSTISVSLKNRLDALNKNSRISVNDPDVAGIIIMMLQDQTQFLNGSFISRMKIIKVTASLLPLEAKTELESIEADIYKLHKELINGIDRVKGIENEVGQAKLYFSDLNAYRNKARKEIIKFENIQREAFRNNKEALYQMKQFKQLVNIEAPKAVKQVVDADANLKKIISEILNASNK